jgi:diguanylate cyclase (GGDEF)-like protein/PAS domain S-box-containing protein
VVAVARRTAVFAVCEALAILVGRLSVIPGTELPMLVPVVGVGLLWVLLATDRAEVVTAGTVTFVVTVAGWLLIGREAAPAVLLAFGTTALALLTRLAAERLRLRTSPGAAPVAPSGDIARLRGIGDLGNLLVASLPGAAVAVGLAALASQVSGDLGSRLVVPGWAMLFLASSAAVLLPALAVRSWRQAPSSWPWVEIVVLFAATMALQYLVFGPASTLSVGYPVLVLLFWSGLRTPPPVAAVHGVFLGGVALALTVAARSGPFMLPNPIGQAVAVQGFLALATVLALLVSLVMTEREALTASLTSSEQEAIRYATETEQIFADAPQGVAVLRPDGLILRVNAALCTMLGTSPEEVLGQRLPDLSPAHAAELQRHLDEVAARPGARVATDCMVTDRSGAEVHVAMSSSTLTHHEGGEAILVNLVDISERRRYERQLAHLADHDVLTGLANRRAFDRALHEHDERCRRNGAQGAMMLLDLDHFKEVNDTLGHGAGDELIVSVAALLRSSFRGTDLVARLGGDEFAILLPDSDRAAAQVVAERLVRGIEAHAATLDGVRRRVTASVGVITFAAAQWQDADPMALADMLMYDAKEAGRNGFALLDESGERLPRVGARLAWRTRLERALEEDLFTLHLQPILDLRRGRIGSAEALVRLVDEDEPVSPGRFVYIAERHGLAPALDAWVIRHSVELLARLREVDPDFELEVNLSGHSIGDPMVEDTIVRALAQHHVEPSALVLEVTETAAVAVVERARAFAARMTAIGTRFALDDFGAGFGSFYYLKHLAFDFIKIDGEFVANCHASSVDRSILRSIVGIAQDLGKQTVAEFVGDAVTLDVVRRLGVDFAQGFHVGRPVPAADFIDRLRGAGDTGLPVGPNGSTGLGSPTSTPTPTIEPDAMAGTGEQEASA